MTNLKLRILKLLAERGPMRDVELWQHTTELSIKDVTVACIALKDEGYIENPPGRRPVQFEYRLTEKGAEYIASSSAERTNA
jgi:DNA-binding PadR family transcriptional regulator